MTDNLPRLRLKTRNQEEMWTTERAQGKQQLHKDLCTWLFTFH